MAKTPKYIRPLLADLPDGRYLALATFTSRGKETLRRIIIGGVKPNETQPIKHVTLPSGIEVSVFDGAHITVVPKKHDFSYPGLHVTVATVAGGIVTRHDHKDGNLTPLGSS